MIGWGMGEVTRGNEGLESWRRCLQLEWLGVARSTFGSPRKKALQWFVLFRLREISSCLVEYSNRVALD